MLTAPYLVLVLTAAAAAAAASSPTHDVAAQFQAAGIVPDILPRFAPSALAFLTFPFNNGSSITLPSAGTRLGRDDAQLTPTFSLVGLPANDDDAQRYVGLVVDPDAPSRADPTRRSIRHYFAADLRIGSKSQYVQSGRTLVNATAAANEFRGPNPPAGSGPHRYVFLLYRQPRPFDYAFLDLADRADRAAFNVSAFAARTGLGDPVAGTYFVAEVASVVG